MPKSDYTAFFALDFFFDLVMGPLEIRGWRVNFPGWPRVTRGTPLQSNVDDLRSRLTVGSIEYGSRRLRDEIDNVVRYDLAFAGAIYFSDLSKFREARCKLR